MISDMLHTAKSICIRIKTKVVFLYAFLNSFENYLMKMKIMELFVLTPIPVMTLRDD